jgi:cystathionine beta-lyase/cystathionine gamma-synthase
MREALRNESSQPFYTRGFNPTVDQLNRKMAALEGAEAALSFASGSAAVAAAVMANVKSGDHIVCVKKPYSWTNKLLSLYLTRFGVETTFVDGTKASHFQEAIKPETRIIYLESPNSFTFELQPLRKICKIAREYGIITIVDNSYASPLYQQPIALGADMVVHSATKYINGHSDAVGGVLCGSKSMIDKIFATELMNIGGVISPYNAWLMLRGLRTLPIRMERVSRSTAKVTAMLEKHPQIAEVLYPFSKKHPQYKLARKQMKRGAGQFSIVLKTEDPEKVELFCNSLKRFLMGASWGGYESLIFPACTLGDSANYQNSPFPFNLIRFYIGLESPKVLIEDLKQALALLD